MAAETSDLWSVEHHLDRVHEATASWRGLPVPRATPGGRYPLVYPRDVNIITKALDRLHLGGVLADEEAQRLLRGAARFLLHVQEDDGRWGQRYRVDGTDASIYRQEDGTAHGVATVARHLLLEARLGEASPVEERVLQGIRRGLQGAWERDHHEDVGLVRSTTSVHESGIERGFTLWTNGAFVEALDLGAQALARGDDDEGAELWWGRRGELLNTLVTVLVRDGRYMRKLHPDGTLDERPGVSLLSPWLFRFRDVRPDAEARAVAFLEQELAHDRFGLLNRYPPSRKDRNVHMHGGHGPYLSFSAWWATRRGERGDRSAARRVLQRLAALATNEGKLPEHVASSEVFDGFVEEEVLTGLDARKELDPSTLREDATPAMLLREAGRMATAYGDAHDRGRREGDGVARLAVPHAWTHAWFAAALTALEGSRAPEGPLPA